jgi:hypothetical protein
MISTQTRLTSQIVPLKLVLEEPSYSPIENLLIEIQQEFPYDFTTLDWESISSMKNWTLDFIRDTFKYFNVCSLVSFQDFSEEFLVEILEELMGKGHTERQKVINIIHNKYNNKYNNTLSDDFKKNYLKAKHVSKIKKIKKVYAHNIQMERVIDYIKDELYSDYHTIDFNALSSFRHLSENFIREHINMLNINQLLVSQKFTQQGLLSIKKYIKEHNIKSLISGQSGILTIELAFELDIFRVKNLFNNTRISNVDTDAIRKKYKILDDCYPIEKSYKKYQYLTMSYDTFFLDLQ